MALNITVSSSNWIDLSARGFVAGMYLVNPVGAPIEYSTTATPAAGSTVQGSSAVQVKGTYLWVRGFGDCELYTASEWSAANAKTVPMTATLSGGKIAAFFATSGKVDVVTASSAITYDASGRVLTRTDARGVWTLAYDYAGRLTTETNASGTVRTHSYDTSGRWSGVVEV